MSKLSTYLTEQTNAFKNHLNLFIRSKYKQPSQRCRRCIDVLSTLKRRRVFAGFFQNSCSCHMEKPFKKILRSSILDKLLKVKFSGFSVIFENHCRQILMNVFYSLLRIQDFRILRFQVFYLFALSLKFERSIIQGSDKSAVLG